MEAVVPDQVRQEVRKFWDIMSGKSGEKLADLYSPSAIVITGKGRQPEPANQALARRAQQLGDTTQDVSAELGELEVQVVGDVAVVSYTYQFHTARTITDGTLRQRHTLYGRATQVFQRDPQGRLRIVHEHLSAAASPKGDN
ncbi:MAG TPA: DUF4440 domain-containing protein [Verrucomicrobiae bacterium]|jgi:ketosteroid isomerase-like protein|nr:DUF4440 domain-containing protein [Verrucomicrobiae bacterium]